MKKPEPLGSMSFESVKDYIGAYAENPPGSLAIMPINMAAEALGLVRTSVERMLKAGTLSEIRVPDTRGVRTHDVLNILDWKKRQEEIVRELLERYAFKGEPVYYADVMVPIGLSSQVSSDRARIGAILGHISEQSFSNPRTKGLMLSVLVHKKPRAGKASSQPSDGFYNLAGDLTGKPITDEEKFLREQMALLRKYFREESDLLRL